MTGQTEWTDGALLPQVKLGPRVGAVKEQVGHAMLYVNAPMTLVNLSVGYYATPVETMMPLWLWYAIAFVLFGAAVAFHHVVVHKSWVEFNTSQGADTDVNPQYRRMVDDHGDQEELLRAIADELDVDCQEVSD